MRNLFFILCFLLPLSSSAQTLSLHEKKVTVLLNAITLEEALEVVSISYGVQFSYSDDIVPTKNIISLNIQNEILLIALEELLAPYGVTFKVVNDNRVILRKVPGALTQTVRGTVFDLVSRSPIPGSTISIQYANPAMGAITDEYGKFKIDHVPIGRISVSVTSMGYDSTTVRNLLLGTGKELVVNVALAESVTHMNEVVITALKNDGIPGGGVAVTSSRTFSVEETKRFAGSMGDPARMASAFAGVTGGSDENNALIVRGNSPRGVLWRVEGIEIPNPNHFTTEGASSGVVSVLSPNMISNSDFLTGAFPAQYGNVLSAVFDINLRDGNNEKQEYSLQAGLLGLEASAEGPFSKQHPSSYLVNYRYSTLSVLDALGVDFNDAGQYKDYQDLSFNINYPTAHTGKFSLFGIGGKSKSRKSDATILDSNLSDVGVLGLTYEHMLNENTFLQGSASFSGTAISNFREVNGADQGPFATEESYSKSFARASFSLRRRITNRYFAEAGVIMTQLRYNFFLKTINPENSSYPVIINFSEHERDQTYIAQGFLYARQYFLPSLFGFYGFHFLRFALTADYSIEPRAGLRWEFKPNKSLSVAYGRHSRIENLQYYLARDHQSGGNEVQINKDLGFTRADHLVLSFEEALSPNHRLKIESYYQKLYNAPVQTNPTLIYASINEDSGFITDSLINKGRGRNYGVELSLEKSFSNNFYYLLNGSVFQSRFSVGDSRERNTAYDGNYSIHLLGGKEFQLRQRNNLIGLNIKITQTGGRRYVPIDLGKSIEKGNQIHDWEAAFDHQLPAYFRTDFQLVYKINRQHYSFEWRLDIQNLTNHKNAGWYYYNPKTQSIRLKNQIGIVPLLSWRVDF